MFVKKDSFIRTEQYPPVKVLCGFFVATQQLEDGSYASTSSISDIYEVGETLLEACMAYLSSIVDELYWLQEHLHELSIPLQNYYKVLQSYLLPVPPPPRKRGRKRISSQ